MKISQQKTCRVFTGLGWPTLRIGIYSLITLGLAACNSGGGSNVADAVLGGGNSNGGSSSNVTVLADFEDPNSWGAGWTVSGNAFLTDSGAARKPPEDGWEDRVSGGLGSSMIDTFVKDAANGDDLGDAATGSLESPDITISSNYLNLAVDGGNHTGLTAPAVQPTTDVQIANASSHSGTMIEILIDGEVRHFLTGDADFPISLVGHAIDLSDDQGKTLKIRVQDQSTASWGFIVADQFGLSNSPAGTPDQVIGSFDDAQQMVSAGWQVTGDFANPASADAWVGKTRDTGRQIGTRAMATCEIAGPGMACESPTGTLTSPLFTVNSRYLNFALAGGLGDSGVAIQVLDSADSVLTQYMPTSCKQAIDSDGDWFYLDLNAYLGQQVKVRIVDNSTDQCGFVSMDHLYLSQYLRGTKGENVARSATDQINVTVADDGFTDVIARFDDPAAMLSAGWQATGAFSDPAGTYAWTGTTEKDSSAARVGIASVSTCEIGGAGCDAPTGTLVSPAFTVNADKISFLMTGGDGSVDVGVQLLDASNNLLAEYKPNGCGTSFIDGDDDWHHFDVSAFVGQDLHLQIMDNHAGACGFLSFDHFYQSNTGAGDLVATAEPIPEGVNVTLPSDALAKVIGDFDDPAAMLSAGWVATGAFENPATTDAWAGTARTSDASAARVGDQAISTCEIGGAGCDAPTGSLTSPAFTVSDPFISFLMAGGDGTNVGVDVRNTDGDVIASYRPNTCGTSYIDGDNDWHHIDVSSFIGEAVTLYIFDNSLSGCGFLSFDHFYQSGTGAGDLVATANDADAVQNVTLAADGFADVVANFDDPVGMLAAGWTATGAFANPAMATAWQGTTRDATSAKIGSQAVGTCEIGGAGCDAPTGTLESPLFTVNADKISFLMSGGDGSADLGVQLLDASGSVLASYRPSSCSPSHIDGDDDWHHIDVSALSGEQIKLKLYDNFSGGCGFLSFDHFYQSSTGAGDLVATAELPAAGTNVTVPSDAFENVVGDFDDPAAMLSAGWVATGAFENPTTTDAWAGTARTSDGATARVGDQAVSTCEIGGAGCDGPTGTLTSPAFTVAEPLLGFLMAGGDGANVGLDVKNAGGDVIASYRPSTCGPSYIDGDNDWHHIDMSNFIGESVTVEIFDNASGGCGFVSFDHLYQTGTAIGDLVATANLATATKNITVAAGGFSDVVASFDDPVAMLAAGWSATGAFANPAIANAWQGTTSDASAAVVGGQAVSTCEIGGGSCDGPTGTLTSPLITVNSRYLNFLMAGGDGSADVGLNVLDSTGNLIAAYRPSSCGPSYIDGNDDWHHIDLQEFMSQQIQLELVDNHAGGCGFVSFDHAYFSSSSDGDLVSTAIAPTNATMSAYGLSAPAIVVGDFDDASVMLGAGGWSASGDFAGVASADAWVGSSGDGSAARMGNRALSTCELLGPGTCDSPTGDLTSPSFTVASERPYLNFMIAGGNGSAPVGIEVLDAGDAVVATFTPNSCGPSFVNGDDDWAFLDLSGQVGQTLRVRLFDREPGGCGFVGVDHIHLSRKPRGPALSANHSGTVIADFDNPYQMLDDGWTATGAFANPASKDAWTGTARSSNASAIRVGEHAVSTCEIGGAGCDGPTGELISPAFTLAHRYLNFMMGGGNGSAPVGLQVLNASNDAVIASYTPNSCGPSHIDNADDWHHVDLDGSQGMMVKVRLFDEEAGGCGFVSFDHLYTSDSSEGTP